MSTRLTLGNVEMFRRNGHSGGVTEIAERVRDRLFSLPMFMKELKQRITIAFNFATGRRGTLWEGRYKCTLVHYGEALRAVAAYIDLNPVRAGLVERPESYRWCSYGAAVGGMKLARSGLAEVVTAARGLKRKMSWSAAQENYRGLLFGIGHAVHGGKTPDGYVKSKGGFSQREIEAVLAAGGRLSLAAALRCRVRYFSDGVVLGSQQFVDEFFEARRSSFGKKRSSGGRRMKGASWGGLRVLRDLRVEPIRSPDS